MHPDVTYKICGTHTRSDEVGLKNACNSIRRNKMLAAVMDKAPNIFPFVHSNYAEISYLFWGMLCLLYLDDRTVGSLTDDVVSDLAVIEEAASELGLHLNRNKSEVICHGRETYDFISFKVPEINLPTQTKRLS